MSDLTLTIKLTDAGMAAVAAAHGMGVQAKITHVAVGDVGYAPTSAVTALQHELARVELTAGGPIAPQQVLLQGMIPAGGTEFFIREMAYFLEDGTLLGVWSDPVTPLGWIGGATPWFFKLAFAWTALPDDSITVLVADDSGQAGMALDLARLEGKVRHTVETGGNLSWIDADETQLTAAIITMIGEYAPPPPAATAAPLMDGAAAVGVSDKLARQDHRHPTDSTRAPLASPALTGTPTTPTPDGANPQQITNVSYVLARIAALVASSPATLDTLNELAAALGNDPNFATTMTSALAGKLPKSGGGMTGAFSEAFAGNIISAPTMDIWGLNGNFIGVEVGANPVVTYLGVAPQVGAYRRLYCLAGTTFVNSGSMRICGNKDYTTRHGDIVHVYANAISIFDITIHKADGTAVSPSGIMKSLNHDQQLTADDSHGMYYMPVEVVTGMYVFLPPSAGLKASWVIGLRNNTTTGNLYILPSSGDVVNGGISVTLFPGEFCTIHAGGSPGAGFLANITRNDAPAGKIDYFAMPTPPAGWIKCNGAALPRAGGFSRLFSAIGTTYGAGDGSTTFNLPDLRGEFIRGWDDGRGADAGRVFGSHQRGTLVFSDSDLSPALGAFAIGNTSGTPSALSADLYTSDSGYPALSVNYTSAPTGGIVVDNTFCGISRPRNVALLACIKY